jgi:acylphosphatase
MMAAFQAIVRGSVQGVGFRWFVLRQAQSLSIRGQVRNLPDRAVEVLAEGDRPDLESLLIALRQGSTMARVSEVELHWLNDDQRFSEFEVTF